jgi:hypothetical protein
MRPVVKRLASANTLFSTCFKTQSKDKPGR